MWKEYYTRHSYLTKDSDMLGANPGHDGLPSGNSRVIDSPVMDSLSPPPPHHTFHSVDLCLKAKGAKSEAKLELTPKF